MSLKWTRFWVIFLGEVIAAIMAAIEAVGYKVFDTDASKANLGKPFVVISGSDGNRASETTMVGDGGEDVLRIKHVSTSAESVRKALSLTRPALNNRRFTTTFGVVDVRFDATSEIYFDPDVTIPNFPTHPHICVDEYTLFIQ